MSTDSGESRHHTSTTVIALLTLVLTGVSAVPGFLALNKEHAEIYFSSETTGITIPSSVDEPKVRAVLSANGIPTNYLSVSVINQGNREAPAVRVSIDTTEPIISAWTDPKPESKPIWVELPDLSTSKGLKQLRFLLKNLAVTKPVMVHVGFFGQGADKPSVQVFADGAPATQVADIATVGPWSTVGVFRLPLIVFGIGIGIVLLWALGVVVSKNPGLKGALEELVQKAVREVLTSILPRF